MDVALEVWSKHIVLACTPAWARRRRM